MKTHYAICLQLAMTCSMAWFSPCTLQAQEEIDFSFRNPKLSIEERAEILVGQMTLREKVGQLINNAPAIDRLEVPSYNWWSEALHGVARNGKATVFPQAIGLGATFDPELIYRMADAISTEARAKYKIAQSMGNHSQYAGLTFWSPTVNLYRDPRYGRGQECYGEDPLLMSKIGVAFVKGLQGDHPKVMKVAACAKHFAMHSGPEEGKLEFNVVASPQDLEESYFPAFEALVKEGKVEGVMTAYNMVFGKPAVTSDFLVKETLLDRWGFDGYVTSDCGAISGAVNKQGYAKDMVDASVLALQAGVNLNCGYTYKKLEQAVKENRIDEELIHERCVQLFKTRIRLGMFDPEEMNPYDYGPEVIHSDEHIRLSREVAQKSIVLLKNKNHTLPLSPEIKVPYVTGPFANSNDMLMGSYYGITTSMVTVLEGIADAVSLGTSLNYRAGALPFQINPNPKNWGPSVAAHSDAVICVVGTTADMEGEGVDAIASLYDGDKLDLRLPENQRKYIHQLLGKKKKDTPFILVIASGGPVTLEDIEEHCDAILQVWYPGEQGGNAVADILFGKVSPSGKLPITFPKNEAQLPPYDHYSMQGRTYKYMSQEPMYPFGFGLSYSPTKFSSLSLSSEKISKGKDLQVEVTVENKGKYNQEEVVQLYLCPEEVNGGIALRSLKSFQRIALKKGESKTLHFTIPSHDLEVVNEQGVRTWRKGKYQVVVGNASPGSHSTRLGAAEPQVKTVTLK